MFHIALWEPEIPPNTGNVARLCAATGAVLHLVGRLGFRTDDRSLKRAGLDYWDAVEMRFHGTFSELEAAVGPEHIWCVETPATMQYTQAKFLAGGLIVDAARMRKNLDMTGGLIAAEAVMMALAEKIGRGAAHDCVYGACRKALDNGTMLLDELAKEPKVTAAIDHAALTRLVDPAHYLGAADAMIDRVLASHKRMA